MKPQIPRVYEPDAEAVHYKADDLSGNVTLCGLTDFLGARERGADTDDPVTCDLCKAIVRYVHEHAKPKDLG
jgi:hypothetical protein